MTEFTQEQIDKAQAVIDYVDIDPLTGQRHCRWCKFPADSRHRKGDYLCPQCQRWQNAKAFPDGVPGLTQETSNG